MSKKYDYLFEVKVPNGSDGWKRFVNDEMSYTTRKLQGRRGRAER